jgi:hypothetical protein
MQVPSTRPADRSGTQTVTVDSEFVRTEFEQAPPEIIRFRSGGVAGDYYHALSNAAAVRLRLLGTLHTRGELAGPAAREAARRRLAAQQRQAWQQLQWLVAEMRRLDDAGR